MPETLGSVIDRLITVDMKMWNAQEVLYEIRKMSFDEFVVYYHNTSGLRKIYNALQKACDLNIQRAVLIDDIDKTLLDILKSDNPEEYHQPKCKTY
jgi:hypothetical protein